MPQTARAILRRRVRAPLRRSPPADARTFAWKVSGKGGVVYLVGSVHLLSKDFYPLNPALEAAYKDSDLLVEEVDLGEMLDPTAQFGLLQRACCRRPRRSTR